MSRILKGILIAAIIFHTGVEAQAFIIAYDEEYFFSQYARPNETIDFNHLKDGTNYEDASFHNPYIASAFHSHGGNYEVWETGWSDSLLIRGMSNLSGFQLVTRWDGESIRMNRSFYPRLSIHTLTTPTPIALYLTSDVYSGFLGFIPETRDENHFWFYAPNFRVTELKAGFKRIQPVPEPGSIFFILTGIILLVALKQFHRLGAKPCGGKFNTDSESSQEMLVLVKDRL